MAISLYGHSKHPRVHCFYTNEPTPASAYRLQQQLLAAYKEVLFHWWDLDQLLTTCFGPRTGKRLQAAEDRVQYEVPEIIERMTPAELEAANTVFLEQTLVVFIGHVLQQERAIVWRMREGNCYTRASDDSHARAAGFGVKIPCACHAPAVDPTDVQRVPAPSCAALRPGIITPAVAPTASAILLCPLQLRVKRAQERKRLKRKRR